MKRWLKDIYGKVIFETECSSDLSLVETAIAEKVDLAEVNLSFMYLRGICFNEVNLNKAKLVGINLQEATITNSCLRRGNLEKANLSQAVITDSDFYRTNLSCTDLVEANVTNTNFFGANLFRTDLSKSFFRDNDIRYTIGNGKEIQTMCHYQWVVTFTKTDLAIGCQQHTHEEWKNFTDFQIEEMDLKALAWWKKWKDHIFKTIELGFEGQEVEE